jgi:hypothetical protein
MTNNRLLTIETIIERLQDRNLSEVARRTKLSFQCVWRIANKRHGNVGYLTVKKLSDYLEAQV